MRKTRADTEMTSLCDSVPEPTPCFGGLIPEQRRIDSESYCYEMSRQKFFLYFRVNQRFVVVWNYVFLHILSPSLLFFNFR